MKHHSANSWNTTLSIPRPGKALVAVMVALTAIWMFYAAGLETGGAGAGSFANLVGNSQQVLRGEIWRLFTAPLLHVPTGPGSVSHLLFTLIGLYFFGTSLERSWSAKRFLGFLYGACLTGFVVQVVVDAVLPLAWRGVTPQVWFGANGAVQALAIAWLLANQGQPVRLFGAVAVSPKVFAMLVVGACLFHAVFGRAPEGMAASLSTLAFGYLVGGEPSTIRRLWLRFRLRKLQSQAQKMTRGERKFRVIEGGKSKTDSDDASKKWLN